jgi:hypothetical protein
MKKGTEEDYKRYGITVREDGRKEIYVLTETLIGGSFTAFVTFLDENKFKEERKKHAHEDSSTTSANARGWFFTRIDGDYSQSSQEASQTEDDIARAVTKTRVNIEIVSQGVVPKFTREVIEHEILKHLDLNPSKFEISQRDESDVKTLITGTHQERAEAALRQQIKMANAQVAVVNTYRGLISTKDKQHIHTPHSAMEAYDNFAAQMTTDQGCGVPIGFNYQVLDEARLKQILDELDPSAQGGTSKGTLKEEI